MLFRNTDGTLVEVNKLNYINDVEYYKTISSCYGFIFSHKNANSLENILSLSKKGMYNNSNQHNNAYRKDVTKDHYIPHA